MTWLDRCFGTKRLTGVFGAQIPESTGWRIVELTAERNAVRAVVDLNQFPEAAPAKWVARGADSTYATLHFDSSEQLLLDGRVNPGDLIGLDQHPVGGDQMRVSLAGEHLSVVATRSFGVGFTKVEGVRREHYTAPSEAAPEREAWLPGVAGGQPVVDAFAPQPSPDAAGALVKVALLPSESALALDINLGSYPDAPPPGWDPLFNTVRVGLRFHDVSRMTGRLDHGMPWEMAATTSVAVVESDVEGSVTGQAVSLLVRAASAAVSRVSAYQREDR